VTLEIDDVESIPPSTYRKGPRASKSGDLVERAKQSPTRKIAIRSADPKELNTAYKSLVQWRLRHKDQGVQVRKDLDVIYIWIVPVMQANVWIQGSGIEETAQASEEPANLRTAETATRG
jgi:hypothetical protein